MHVNIICFYLLINIVYKYTTLILNEWYDTAWRICFRRGLIAIQRKAPFDVVTFLDNTNWKNENCKRVKITLEL